jgi:hypothetical protein
VTFICVLFCVAAVQPLRLYRRGDARRGAAESHFSSR